jgi:hypothetical protein
MNDFTPRTVEAESKIQAAKIVCEGMASWCVKNTELMFTAQNDIARLVELRFAAGETVVASEFLVELEAGVK